MIISSHAVCAPIVQVAEDGVIRIARMTYQIESEGRVSIRHVMEGGKNGQSVLETLRDGVFREARDPDSKFFMMKMLLPEPILIEFLNDEYSYGNYHLKVVFPVSVPEWLLRKVEMRDHDDPDEIHGPISMVSLDDWMREAKSTVPFHVRVTKAVLTWASVANPKVLYRYYEFIRGWKPKELTDEQKAAIAAYPKRW